MGGLRPFLWPLLAVLGRSWGLCWRSWAALRAYVGGLGSLLGPMLTILVPLGTYVGGLGPLLGLMLAVLGRSWGLCGRSGADKCKEHGHLENVLFLERERDLRPGGRS